MTALSQINELFSRLKYDSAAESCHVAVTMRT